MAKIVQSLALTAPTQKTKDNALLKAIEDDRHWLGYILLNFGAQVNTQNKKSKAALYKAVGKASAN